MSPFDKLSSSKLKKRCRTVHTSRYWEDRDKKEYKCPKCGCGYDDTLNWQVHHIDHNPLNGLPFNLVALCRDCHYVIHNRKPPQSLEDWKEKGRALMES